MSNPADTSQLAFWRGDFGRSYIGRNAPIPQILQARANMWSRILAPLVGDSPREILEVGSNIGLNLRALKVLTDAGLWAVEPNDQARQVLVDDGVVEAGKAMAGVAAGIPLEDASIDLVFTSGVLIHIHPDQLLDSVREIHRVSRRYIACVEYFSDKPEAIDYRNHSGLLFKRDFGGFYMDNFPDLTLVDYGFFWKRVTGLDNLTWWLFRKE